MTLTGEALFSVVVVSYNSQSTILDTLECIWAQRYEAVELIVSDDCSQDATCGQVKAWLKEKGGRFKKAGLVESPVNTGVARNINRGVHASSGSYLKVIAADDCMRGDALSQVAAFFEETGADFCISGMDIFSEGVPIPEGFFRAYRRYYENAHESNAEKRHRLAVEYALPSPGFFYTRKLFDSVGGMDERFPNWEEYPFVYKVLEMGYDMPVLDKRLMLYRYSGASLSQTSGPRLYREAYFRDYRRIFYKFQFPLRIQYHMFGKAVSGIMRMEIYNLRYKKGFLPRLIVRAYDHMKEVYEKVR